MLLAWLGVAAWPGVALAQNDQSASTEPEPDADDPKLPKLKEMLERLPTAEQLLTAKPVDWIVLKTERVIVVEPVELRPGTLAKMQEKIDESRKWKRPDKPDEVAAHFRKREALYYLHVAIPGESEEPEWQLHMKYIGQVIHHEDLMLRRVDLLLTEGKLRDAYEVLFVLERSTPDWPGAIERRNRLLLLEGLASLKENRPDAGLAHLEELHTRDPKFDGLRAALGTVVDRLVADALAVDDFPRCRHFLERLRRREPNHEVFVRRRDEFQRLCQRTLADARDASAARRFDEAAELAHRAARVWPSTPGLPEAHRQHAGRFQTLHVGVVRFADEPTAYPFPADAERRRQRLAETTLFELDGFDDAARYRSAFLDAWEPVDLGRRALLSLRPTRAAWDQTPLLTAGGLATSLAPRLDPRNPQFDERLGAAVRTIHAKSPFELEVTFARAPLHLEALLQAPLRATARSAELALGLGASRHDTTLDGGNSNGAAPRDIDRVRPVVGGDAAGRERPAAAEIPGEPNDDEEPPPGQKSREDAGGPPSPQPQAPQPSQRQPQAPQGTPIVVGTLAPRFHIHARSDERVAFRRAVPEPDQQTRFHVAEIVERKYASRDKAVQGLLKGEVSMLPDVQPWDVERLRSDGRFYLVRSALPTTHVIQFYPESKPLRVRELRRALAYAVERDALVRDLVLRGAPADRCRLVSGPYPTKSRAYDRTVEPIAADPTVSAALALAAKKVLKGKLPELTFVCPPDENLELIARRMTAAWAARGIPVKLVTQPPESGPPVKWDLCYRTVRMAEPAIELWPFLTLDERAGVGSLRHLPQWLSRQLVTLDLTSDWQSSTALLKSLHEQLHAEMELIPLWELDEHHAFRKNLRGMRTEPVTPYQDVESWTVDPWYNVEAP